MIKRRLFLSHLASTWAMPVCSQQSDPLAGRFGGPFDLFASGGRRVTDKDFLGKFLLVYFGYTRCPDVCPIDLLTIGQALSTMGPEAERIQPLFITVDPARDTPAILADYVSSFHPRLLGLWGRDGAIAAVWRSYKVHRVKYVPANDPDNYGIDHSSLTYLMGPDGTFRTIIPHGASPRRMADVVQTYLVKE
jgi:protein SCO1/2